MVDARTLEIPDRLSGLRLDKAVAEAFPDLSRSRVQALVEAGAVLVNGRPPKAALRLHPGDRLSIEIPDPTPSDLIPEHADLDIVYEDEALLVVSKAPGMVVHPGAGASSGTLAAALLDHCGSLSQVGGVTRPGIVHRLDKGTSGLLVVAKNDQAHRALSAQFKARTVTKIYRAICHGVPRPERGSLTLAIGRDPRNRKRMAALEGGRSAHTDYEVAEKLGVASVVRLTLHSGRTHQIRVHLAAIHCALVGDKTYGATACAARAPQPLRDFLAAFPRPALHAECLGFIHPGSGKALFFQKVWPDDLAHLHDRLVEAHQAGEGKAK